MESSTASDIFRTFFAGIVKFIYKFFSGAIDLMENLAGFDFGMDSYIDSISEKIFNILIIFMLFKVTISFLLYLTNPDSFLDKGKGVSGLIKRILITLTLLISINPLFEFLKDLQRDILDSNIIVSILGDKDNGALLTLSDEQGNSVNAYGVRMNPECEDGKYVYTFSSGDHISLLLLKPFIQPYTESEIREDKYEDNIATMNESGGYCGVTRDELPQGITVTNINKKNKIEKFRTAIDGPNSAEGFMYKKYVTGENTEGKNTYIYDFNYFMAIICGIIGLLIVISFCFDIVIRSCTIVLLKLLAPIPIISYISPESKSSSMLSNWGKNLAATWASLFIRIATLSIAISFIGSTCQKLDEHESTFIMQIFLILGILMFAKKLPQLLEEIIPGLKLGNGFELNPFKRVQRDALGGNLVLGGVAGVAAYGLGATTNAGHRLINTGIDIHQNGFSFRRLGSGVARTAGSAIAGGTRAGLNAFGRTSKDGRLFRGIWNGYQTSMFSKLQREDNFRKTGYSDNFANRVRVGAQSAVADMARYVGVLNPGQREYLRANILDNNIAVIEQQKRDLEQALANDKRDLNIKKRITLEPYIQYANYASEIKKRIENDKRIKDLQEALDNARAIGNIDAIGDITNRLDQMKKTVSKDLFDNDADVIDLASRLDQLRTTHSELINPEFNYKDKDGSFSSGAIYNVQHTSNIIQRQFNDQERQFEARQTDIDKMQSQINDIKNSEEYERVHDEKSPAKLANASRMNKEPQGPGFKPSTTESSQARVTDSSRYSNLEHNHHGHGGPGTPPPPPRTP